MNDMTPAGAKRRVFVCTCDNTMPLDETAIKAGCGGSLESGEQFCIRERERVREALAFAGPLTIACTQEQPLFEEMAEDEGFASQLSFVNIRELAGWSADAPQAGAKMAALIAGAAVEMPPIPTVPLTSEGVALIIGRDETAIDIGAKLADHLDVTVLLAAPDGVAPPRQRVFPVLKGRVATATGHLGAFELTIDDYAVARPSSRAALAFGASRNGATSTCDLIIDVIGDTPLFPADDLRDGYLRADPRDPAGVQRLIFEASHLIGTFDKPRYVDFDPSVCAHSRSTITGCTRCLDLCPTGAITPGGDAVSIDPAICAGCGQCAGACPTGAASYALPPVDALVARTRAMLKAYQTAGGQDAVLLIHDDEHGAPLIDALARHGEGLPAHVVPLLVNEITQLGPEFIAAAMAYGASGIRFLSRARPKHDLTGLEATLAMSGTILEALGFDDQAVGLIATDDPDALHEELTSIDIDEHRRKFAGFVPPATKRGLMELAFRELHRTAPAPVDVVPLERGAPFGGIEVDLDACTLCLSCVSACPADALTDFSERPTLRFTESLCVQCGLCEATCPEDAITLAPRLDFNAWSEPKKLIKEEEPYCCVECGKAFGTRSTVDRVMAKLEGHWMFSGTEGESRRRVLQMCEDCRVSTVVKESFDPHEIEKRRVRTTDDYLRERNQSKH